jgi:hypothetical protein
VDETLETIVRAFQADVQRGLALFRQYTGSDDLLSWRSRRLPLSGHLDAEKRHHYFFHGIGVRVQLAPKLHIDWDFGNGGRMDGFDLWRLQLFLEERSELQHLLPLDRLGLVFDAAVADGSIISPWRGQHDSLYYIADDLRTSANA